MKQTTENQAVQLLKSLEYETKNGMITVALAGFPSTKEAKRVESVLEKAQDQAKLNQTVTTGISPVIDYSGGTHINVADLDSSLPEGLDTLKNADKVYLCVSEKLGKNKDLKNLVSMLERSGIAIDGSILVK